MMYMVHVRHARAEPLVATRRALTRELPRGRKVKTCTLANPTHWPDSKVEALRRVLRSET